MESRQDDKNKILEAMTREGTKIDGSYFSRCSDGKESINVYYFESVRMKNGSTNSCPRGVVLSPEEVQQIEEVLAKDKEKYGASEREFRKVRACRIAHTENGLKSLWYKLLLKWEAV